MKKLKIGIIGNAPPPYGGITIHVSRLHENLLSKNYEVILIDEYKSFSKLRAKLKTHGGFFKYLKHSIFSSNIYHYHSPNMGVRFFLGLISFLNVKTIITLHGEGIKTQVLNHGWLSQKIYLFALKQIGFIICDNEDLRDFIVGYGIKASKTRVVSAFIPPVLKQTDLDAFPINILNFYKEHDINVFAMGWIKFHKGIDMYGLDMILDLAYYVFKNYKQNVGFVIKLLLSNVQDPKYYKDWIEKASSIPNILIITNDLDELYPLEEMASIVVRPSCTDGDSVSIRESLFFGTPVVTSDAIPRPDGCVLFRNRDTDDFILKTTQLIDKLLRKETISLPTQINNAEKIIEVYNTVHKQSKKT